MKRSWHSAAILLALLGTISCGDDDSGDSGASGGTGGASGGRSGSGGSSGSGGAKSAGGQGGAGQSSGGQASGGKGSAGQPGGGQGGAGQAGAGQGGGGDSGAGGGDSGAGGGDSGAGGQTEGGSGGAPSGPILERPPEIAYDCSVSRPMALLGINPWSGGALIAKNGAPYLARAKGDFGNGGLSIDWSSIGLNGALGTRKTVYDAGQKILGGLSVAPHADRFSLVWSELNIGDRQLMLAEVNAEGTVVAAATPLTFVGTQPTSARIVATDGGRALVWLDQPAELMSELKFVLIDDEGAAQGTPRILAQGGGSIAPLAFTAVEDGFLLVYAHIDYGADLQKTYVVALDAQGEPRRDAVELDGGFGGASILPRGDRALVAWSVGKGGFELSGRSEAIQVAWFSTQGAPIGESVALQEHVIDEENTFPHWVDFGDDVGLFWSKGSIIYICAGCVPDNDLQFVVLDGTDLTPKSAVLELLKPNAFGLLHAQAVREGDDVLVIADSTHHVDAEGASATVSCPESP